MSRSAYHEIILLVTKAQIIASKLGMPNILQPGLVKEIVIADILGHQVIASKNKADARDPQDSSIQFEYLSCYEGGTGQLDRMFKTPPGKRAESLRRITRNKTIYLAIFSKSVPLKPVAIYAIKPSVMVTETNRQLDGSRNDISHVGFSETWANKKGSKIFP